MNSGPTLSRVLSSAALVAGTALFSVGIQAFAFTQPTAPPPGANASAPLTTSDRGQIKTGGLTLGTNLTASQEALHVTNGRIQVGATVGSVPSTVGLVLFGKSLMIADGTQGAGKFLVSDANGKASWGGSSTCSSETNCTDLPDGTRLQWGKLLALGSGDGTGGTRINDAGKAKRKVSLSPSMRNTAYVINVTPTGGVHSTVSDNCTPAVEAGYGATFFWIATDGNCDDVYFAWQAIGK